jgi:uncharacterized membrane protein
VKLTLFVLAVSVSASCHRGSSEPRATLDSTTATTVGDSTDGSRRSLATAESTFLLRGLLVLKGDSGSFVGCGSDHGYRLIDRTGGRLRRVYDGLASRLGERVYAEVVGSVDPEVDRSKRAGGSLTVIELRRASPPGEISGCPRTDSRADLLARGNEPFWSVSVYANRIIFREPENLAGIEFPPSVPVAEKDRRVYRSKREGPAPREIEIVVQETGCTDSMSGEYLHLTAVVTLDDRRLEGCAVASGPRQE